MRLLATRRRPEKWQTDVQRIIIFDQALKWAGDKALGVYWAIKHLLASLGNTVNKSSD